MAVGVLPGIPNGRTAFEDRLQAHRPGEERMLQQFRRMLYEYGGRKHDGDGLYHVPGHRWAAIECKNNLQPDGTFLWEKDSYHDALDKLPQMRVLVLVSTKDGSNPLACWMDDARIVNAKPRTPAGQHTTGDPAYRLTTLGEDGRGRFAPLAEFLRHECVTEVAQ